MEKRGYFFELDAALALFVLVMGAFYIASYYIQEPQVSQVGILSDDILGYLSDTRIKDYDNPYAGIGGELWKSEIITDGDNSLLQQTGIFYHRNQKALVDNFLKNTTSGILPYQYEYEIWLNNEIVYPQVQTDAHNLSKNSTGLILISRKITYGILNKTSSQMWGPYKTEVLVWER